MDVSRKQFSWDPFDTNNDQGSDAAIDYFDYPIAPPGIFYGIAGKITQQIAPETEADPMAIYTQGHK